jgi:signal transduction histidine kinase
MLAVTSLGQDQLVADSLKEVLKTELSIVSERNTLQKLLRHEQNRDSIIVYAIRFLELSNQTNYREGLSKGYRALAGAYYQKGELDKALSYYLMSLEHTDDALDKAIAYADIGSVYQHNEDFPNSFQYYRKAAAIFSDLQDTLRVGTTYISMGYAFYLVDELDSAARILNKSTNIFTTLNYKYNDYYWSYAAGNLALVQAKQQQYALSEETLNKAITILEKYNDAYAISEYKIELAKIYENRGDTRRALELAIEGTELARTNGFKKFIRDGSKILAKFYHERRDFEKAFEYQSLFLAYNDSLVNADMVRQLANQRTEFEVGQKQIEVDLLTVEKRNQRIVLFATAGFAVLLIILASIIYKYYRTKSKINQILAAQKSELESLNQTKDKFFSIISHDLRGPVSSFHGVTRLMRTLIESDDKESLLMFADEMDKSVTQLSALLDNLLNWAMQQQGQFIHSPEKLLLKALTEEMTATLANMAKGKRIELTTRIPDTLQLWADKNTTMTILRNLTNNALKFTPDGGKVTISADAQDQEVEIRVTDIGVGIAQEKVDSLFNLQDNKSTYGTQGEKGLGLGLQLVYEFLELNGGSIRVESQEGQGTTFILRLPQYKEEISA